MANRLINEKSPYLLQHAHNPVDWYPWGEEAFKAAKERDVPVFLSIGYSSCHWCHVMERESFEDIEAAKILNENFVSVKVDREELSDVDHFYMEACQAFTRSGGWPLSAFLAHNREPFFAGTYFPKKDGVYGIGFITLLKRISDMWKNERYKLSESARSMTEFLKSTQRPGGPRHVDIDAVYRQIVSVTDKRYGGIKGAPKFPTAPMLMFLLQYNKLKPDSDTKELLNLTLYSMAAGGIFDHLGGGFFRYSTDERWLVPHFEKMLYDNAMLLYVYSAAAKEIDGRFIYTARKIRDYLFKRMLTPEGGFCTAEDADSEGEEGKYYLFTPEEIVNALGAGAAAGFLADYNVSDKYRYNGKNILNRLDKPLLATDSRADVLLEYRNKRIPPMKDDKILTSSNALAVSALAFSGRVLNDNESVKQAERTADFILNKLFIKGRLMARYRDGEAAFSATLDEYAYLTAALLELYAATFRVKWLTAAVKTGDKAAELFSDRNSGFYLSAKDAAGLPFRMKKYYDGPSPSGNAVLAAAYYSLFLHTGEDKYRVFCDGILKSGSFYADAYPFGSFGHINSAMIAENAVHIGLTTGAGLEAFIKGLNSYNPFIITTLYDKDFQEAFPKAFTGARTSKACAFVCDRGGCRPPVFSPTDLPRL